MLHLFWSKHWQALGANTDGLPLMQELLTAYREPQRQYHTLLHLTDCLNLFESCAHLARHPHEIAIALWFHDAVYDVHAHDNEARSAAWAESALASHTVDTQVASRIGALIMATRHDAAPEDPDEMLMVDIDLAILGTGTDRFAGYEDQVRNEYAWVPDPLYRQARREVLERFLAREKIYHTALFQKQYERQARENLAASLARLI